MIIVSIVGPQNERDIRLDFSNQARDGLFVFGRHVELMRREVQESHLGPIVMRQFTRTLQQFLLPAFDGSPVRIVANKSAYYDSPVAPDRLKHDARYPEYTIVVVRPECEQRFGHSAYPTAFISQPNSGIISRVCY